MATGWTSEESWFDTRQGQGIYLVSKTPRPGLGLPSLHSVGAVGSFPGVKRLMREADNSRPSSAEMKNTWSCTYTPHVPTWRSQRQRHKQVMFINFLLWGRERHAKFW
jgi:hypothetical protein